MNRTSIDSPADGVIQPASPALAIAAAAVLGAGFSHR